MKKIVFLLLAIFLCAGCMSEAQKQAQIEDFNIALEKERIRLKIPEDEWQIYIDSFKKEKCYGNEYFWGQNWRYWAIKDAEKDFRPYKEHQMLIARFQQAYPDTWQQKLLEYDLLQQGILQQQHWIKQQEADQPNREFWKEFGEAAKRANQPPEIIPLTPNNSTYWQERKAQRDVMQNR